MSKGFRLGFGRRRGGEGSPGFGRRGGSREEMDFLGDGTTQVGKRFSDVRRVVVGFIRVLRPGNRDR